VQDDGSDQVYQLIEFVMEDWRFKSLFASSLEFQKYIFTQEVYTRAKEDGHEAIEDLLRQAPYEQYLVQIEQGYNGEDYSHRTIGFLRELAEQKNALGAPQEKPVKPIANSNGGRNPPKRSLELPPPEPEVDQPRASGQSDSLLQVHQVQVGTSPTAMNGVHQRVSIQSYSIKESSSRGEERKTLPQ
jgi:hypothetical protein